MPVDVDSLWLAYLPEFAQQYYLSSVCVRLAPEACCAIQLHSRRCEVHTFANLKQKHCLAPHRQLTSQNAAYVLQITFGWFTHPNVLSSTLCIAPVLRLAPEPWHVYHSARLTVHSSNADHPYQRHKLAPLKVRHYRPWGWVMCYFLDQFTSAEKNRTGPICTSSIVHIRIFPRGSNVFSFPKMVKFKHDEIITCQGC